MRRRAKLVTGALAVALACAPIRTEPSPTPPTNICPDHPCSAYGSGSPMCAGGVCVEPATPTAKRLVLVVSIPVDAPSAPGDTFAVSFADVNDLPPVVPGDQLPILPLPPVASVTGSYLVTTQTTYDLQWNLGNLDLTMLTSLPAHVTYRPFWPSAATPSPTRADDGGAPLTDAVGAGLPLYPVQVKTFQAPPSPGGPVGPAHGPSLEFTANVQSGLHYEQTVAPDPPFDRAYPPYVRVVLLNPGSSDVQALILEMLDTTLGPGGKAVALSFDLARTDAPLDGWTAYLRDATTKRPISPIRPLSGMSAENILLPTWHALPGDDAFVNAELVMAPPAGQPIPTEVFAPPELLLHETYPALPSPASEQGKVVATDGSPVVADLIFEATGIYAAPAVNFVDMSDAGNDGGVRASGDAGLPLQLYPQGFEYVAHASAQPDAQDGTATYQVELPRGEYRVIVRPSDGIHGLRIYEGINTTLGDPPPRADFTVEVAASVQGTAALADGRALSQATVEALPIHCPSTAFAGDAGVALRDSPSCMPRYAQTTTLDDGSFALTLDPGGYILRAEPAVGDRLPWVVVQPVSVPTSEPIRFPVPAPVYRGFELHESKVDGGRPVPNAIVRMFAMPPNGPAFEIGRAITDRNGRFDMYLEPDLAAQ